MHLYCIDACQVDDSVIRCWVLCLQDSSVDQTAVEQEERLRLERLRETAEAEHHDKCEELEKKYAYKMEQLRQEFADKHDQVVTLQLVTVLSWVVCFLA